MLLFEWNGDLRASQVFKAWDALETAASSRRGLDPFKMTNDAPPIPGAIWTRILAFLKAGGSGEITLNVHRGRVRDAWIRERISEADE